MNAHAIEVKKLTKKFGNFTAVDQIHFEIGYGEIFGFLGANGAGKSTTIRMLCGILEPTGGSASVAGFDVMTEPEKIKEAIGYVSQKFSLYTDLTTRENLEFYGRIYKIPEEKIQKRIREIFELTGLGEYEERLAGNLSGGWKQRLAVGNALLHEPKILFLDEPTAGVDPLSRRALWELLYVLADRGVALFVTTHYMEEAERCNKIAFISEGKILKIGKPSELKASVTGNLIEIECHPLMKASRLFQSIPGVIGLTAYGTNLHLNTLDKKKTEEEILKLSKKENIQIFSMKSIEASLEDVFATLEETSAHV